MMKDLDEECMGFVNNMGRVYHYMSLSSYGNIEGAREGLNYLK